MTELHNSLRELVAAWRSQGYECERYPAIAEIFRWNYDADSKSLRYLRPPQFYALEVYWYLRIIKQTPRILDIYRDIYDAEDDPAAFLAAAGISIKAFERCKFSMSRLLNSISNDENFVKEYGLDTVRESFNLGYASYIFALAMGSGKTALIGTIIATEFAMAIAYPDGPFIRNALVFAPGLTIVQSLRQLSSLPLELLLPPHLLQPCISQIKLHFTRDADKDIPVVRGSAYNIIVTNTEKIRIQKEAIRKRDIGRLLLVESEDAARAETANMRLQAIASLPDLGIFSDEAHHTYGQALAQDLKRVRQTVDYLARQTSVVCVVNTTGTPYFKRQRLRDVVVWYSLALGIADGILKELAGNVESISLSDSIDTAVSYVIKDFATRYGDVSLPNGAPAKLALYFPSNVELERALPSVRLAVLGSGLGEDCIIVNTSDDGLSSRSDRREFERLNSVTSTKRIILLVNKGVEGWDCPSLFATALVRKLSSAGNFVLQAATRCLRQVVGNTHPAKVYLSEDNIPLLDQQLKEAFNESLADIADLKKRRDVQQIVIRKQNIRPLKFKRSRVGVKRLPKNRKALVLERPVTNAKLVVTHWQLTRNDRHALQGQATETYSTDGVSLVSVYAAAVSLTESTGVNFWEIYDRLRDLYGVDVPWGHLELLRRQIEKQLWLYTPAEELSDEAVSLLRQDGFIADVGDDGNEIYYAEIAVNEPKQELLLRFGFDGIAGRDIGFHYTPYNFDSRPEWSFFKQMFARLQIDHADVQDLYYTGGVTDPSKTGFLFPYRKATGSWHLYSPDFVIRLRPVDGYDRVVIVEIKADRMRNDPVEGRDGSKATALTRLQAANDGRVRYEMIFTTGPDVSPTDVTRITESLLQMDVEFNND